MGKQGGDRDVMVVDTVETRRRSPPGEQGGRCMKTGHSFTCVKLPSWKDIFESEVSCHGTVLIFPQSAPAKSRKEKHPCTKNIQRPCGLYDLVVSYPFFTYKTF